MPKKPNLKKAVRQAVNDVKAYAKRKGLKARSDAGAGGSSGIFSQFEGAKYSNKRSWINTPWPADQKRTMTTFDRQELTRKMRWLSVNSGLIRQLISDNVIYSIADGIRHQPASGDHEWDKIAYDYFLNWANKPCEVSSRFNFWECQQIACRKVDVDGEIFVLKTYASDGSPLIQMIESHRVGTSANASGTPDGMWDGIMFNKFGAVIGYNVIKSDGTTRLIPANSICHIYHPEQVSGARAYSPLQHSINNLIDILEILSLEKVAVKTSSDITRTITRENPQFDGSSADFEAFGMRPQDYPNEVYNNPEQVGSFIGGKILSLAPGEKLESFQSQRPNETFNGFIEHLNRDSTAGFLPYEFSSDPSKVGGAAVRLVVSKAERFFGSRQHMFMTRFLSPVYSYIIGTAIANGDIPAPKTDDWNRVNWVTPRRVTVDAGRESSANQRDIEMGLKTLSDHFAELGMNPVEEVRRRASDARLLIDTAKEFNVPVSMLYKPTNTPSADIDQTATAYGDGALPADNGFTPLDNP